jgi:holo-[acyl-carrier protein] synthase
MIYGIGIDIVEIGRIKNGIKKFGARFMKKIYTQEEIKMIRKMKNKYAMFASLFALKEAFLKALRIGIFSKIKFNEIQISKKKDISLSSRAKRMLNRKKIKKIFADFSFSKEYAIAVVILEK